MGARASAAWLLCLLWRWAAGAEDAACECLNWKRLYDAGDVVCGEGLELYEMTKPRLTLSLAEAAFSWKGLGYLAYWEYCSTFFRRMDNNFCVNAAMTEYATTDLPGQTWCYVSDECAALNGGQKVPDKQSFSFLFHALQWLPNRVAFPLMHLVGSYLHSPQPLPRRVSWKVCSKGPDRRLRDMPPLEVLDLARSMDSVIGFVSKIAYQRLPPPAHTWASIEGAVAAGDIAKMPRLLQDAIAAKDPVVIDVDPEGHTHQRIVRGTEVYELEQQCDLTGCGARHWPFRRGRDVGEL